MSSSHSKNAIAYVSTFPPRECGIATFTADLMRYTEELYGGALDLKVIAMNASSTGAPKYPDRVFLEIHENDRGEYVRAAERLNAMPEVKAVSVQHEFGIYGEQFGQNVLALLETLEKPAIVTLHTVLEHPPEGMRRVAEGIIRRAARLVAMTELSRRFLIEVYGARPEQVEVIPHGIHPELYAGPETAKKKFGLEGKRVLMTFGLLSRGKGIEYAIRAMPAIVEKFPDAIYLVLGATHPIILEREGEEYRDFLTGLARELGVEAYVRFENRYLSTAEVLEYLRAADLYLALSQDPDQTVSGTLAYGLGAGRAVLSTPFTGAKELVDGDVGAFIAFRDPDSVSREVIRLFADPGLLTNLGKNAYFKTRRMTWTNVALAYVRLLAGLAPDISVHEKRLPPWKLDHLKDMTDDFGVLQFASLHNPDPQWGYTLDDSARALAVFSWYDYLHEDPALLPYLDTALGFIERAAKPEGGFINYFTRERAADEHMNARDNQEDSNARAFWALAMIESHAPTPSLEARAEALLQREFTHHRNVASPRAAAFYIRAFAEHVKAAKRGEPAFRERIEHYADFLSDIFRRSSDGEWHWFEESMTYSNGLLVDGMLAAYEILKKEEYLAVARQALDFLIEKSFEGDVCVPIGQGDWLRKGKQKIRYDEQPEEVFALVLALAHMHRLTGEESYEAKLRLAFDWFLGNNLARQVVYMHSTGGCYDGIGKHGVNLNQGAESTISYLLARLAVEPELMTGNENSQ